MRVQGSGYEEGRELFKVARSGSGGTGFPAKAYPENKRAQVLPILAKVVPNATMRQLDAPKRAVFGIHAERIGELEAIAEAARRVKGVELARLDIMIDAVDAPNFDAWLAERILRAAR